MPFLPYYAPPPGQVAMLQQAAATTPTVPAGTHNSLLAANDPPAGGGSTVVSSHGYEYTVVGNRLLSPTAILAAVQGAADPKAAVGALKAAYMRRGYFLVALVARVTGKQVQVRVVQGRLTHIEGPPALARFFEGLKNDDSVRESDVIRRSTLAQAYASTNGQQPQISFHPAPEYGGSEMQIGETPTGHYFPLTGGVTFGNVGNRYAARYLGQAQATLSHYGFTLQATYSHGFPGLSDSTRGAAYHAEGLTISNVNPLGSFQLNYSATRYQLGDAFAPLFPLGHIQLLGLSGTQSLYADDRTRWTLNEGLQRIHDDESVFQGVFTLRDQHYWEAHVGSDVVRRFDGLGGHAASLSAGGAVKVGWAGSDSGFQRTAGAPRSHFQVYTLHAGVTQSLPHDFNMALDLNGQIANQTLPSYEQWLLGGLNNMTAYLPGTVAGDRGYLGRFTLQAPQWTVASLQLRPSLFAESGAARFTYIAPQAPVWQRLTDAGAQLSVNVPMAHLAAVLAYAKPFDSSDVSRSLRLQQAAHWLFYLQTAW